MFKLLFLSAYRNLIRHKQFTIINLAGLSFSLAACIVIALFLKRELSFDKFHSQHKQTYLVAGDFKIGDQRDLFEQSSLFMGEYLQQEFPQIKSITRFGGINGIAKVEDDNIALENAFVADSNFFETYDFKILEGDKSTCLSHPSQFAISESGAKRLFGTTENLIGKQFMLDDEETYEVAAIFEDTPDNSSIEVDYVRSLRYTRFDTLPESQRIQSMWNLGVNTLIILHEGRDISEIEDNFDSFYDKYMSPIGKMVNASMSPMFIRLDQIHLHQPLVGVFKYGQSAYVKAFRIIGLLILLLAAINYINLSTARASVRAKEIGVKRVVGAYRSSLRNQFLTESLLLAFVAFILSLGVAEIFLSTDLSERIFDGRLSLNLSGDGWIFILISFSFALFIGFLSGLYPAFYLSRISPVNSLKGIFKQGRTSLLLRKGLITLQFAISIFTIAATLLMGNQIQFMRNKDLGFDLDQLIRIESGPGLTQEQARHIQDVFEKSPHVNSTAYSSFYPGGNYGKLIVFHETETEPQSASMANYSASFDFLSTFGFEMVKGRNFSPEFPSDSTEGIIINETAMHKFGWEENPIGKTISRGRRDNDGNIQFTRTYKVIGVVKDFFNVSLHSAIEPFFIIYSPRSTGNIFARVQAGNIEEGIAHLKDSWTKEFPERPFKYSFHDERWEEQYTEDKNTFALISIMSGLCILISCIGLFGLAAFTITQRTKEIGVRKVLGASVTQIIFLLFKDILILLSGSIFLGSLSAWYVIQTWLENFAYTAPLNVTYFLVAGVISLAISFLTVFFHTYRAATSNPVLALRYE